MNIKKLNKAKEQYELIVDTVLGVDMICIAMTVLVGIMYLLKAFESITINPLYLIPLYITAVVLRVVKRGVFRKLKSIEHRDAKL